MKIFRGHEANTFGIFHYRSPVDDHADRKILIGRGKMDRLTVYAKIIAYLERIEWLPQGDIPGNKLTLMRFSTLKKKKSADKSLRNKKKLSLPSYRSNMHKSIVGQENNIFNNFKLNRIRRITIQNDINNSPYFERIKCLLPFNN